MINKTLEKKYLNSEFVKQLQLTKEEIEKFSDELIKIYEQNLKCDECDGNKCNSDISAKISLRRDENGKLDVCYISCPLLIQNKNLIYRDFHDYQMKIKINKTTWPFFYSDEQKKLYDDFKKKLQNKNDRESLFLYGDFSTGKTTFAIGLANELAIKGKTICYINVKKLETWLNYHMKESVQREEMQRKMINCDYLFLDEFDGSRKEWTYEFLIDVIEERTNNNHNPIIFISNQDLMQIEKHFNKIFNDQIAAKRYKEKIKKIVKGKIFNIKGKIENKAI